MSEQSSENPTYKQKRFRSPPYPAVSLSKAVARAKELYEKAQHHSVPTHVLANAWGYTTKSSAINSTSAALKQFGLMNDVGSGDKRRFNLTDQAIRIIKDPVPDSLKRTDAIKRAALAPKIHAELWEQFGLAGLSGSMDPTLLSYLTIDKKEAGIAPYSDSAAQEVISIYKETISYAGLGQLDIVPGLDVEKFGTGDGPDAKSGNEENFGGAKVGDMVQWESSGELKLETAKRVRAVTVHDGAEWVFLEGSETGVPMNEIIIEKEGDTYTPPNDMAPPLLPIDPKTESGLRKAVFPVDDGDVTLIFPKGMTAASFDELDQYMQIFLKKEKKKSTQEKVTKASEE